MNFIPKICREFVVYLDERRFWPVYLEDPPQSSYQDLPDMEANTVNRFR